MRPITCLGPFGFLGRGAAGDPGVVPSRLSITPFTNSPMSPRRGRRPSPPRSRRWSPISTACGATAYRGGARSWRLPRRWCRRRFRHFAALAMTIRRCAGLIAAGCVALPASANDGDLPVVETSNAAIASQDGERLRVVFAAEGQPALLFKAGSGKWDWQNKSKLVIPVGNPSGEPVTLLLRIEDEAHRSLSGKIAIAPADSGDLALWIDAPAPRSMGMIAGPSLTAAGLEPHGLRVTATEGSVDSSHIAAVRFGIARSTAPR